MAARRFEELERVKKACVSNQVAVMKFDLADINEMEEKIKKAISFFGGIDILINNAGISQQSLAKETDWEVDRKIMDVCFYKITINPQMEIQ